MAKKRDTFGDSPLGSGGRFAECVREMEKRPDVYDPAGLCASIGRKAYGKKRFAKMAQRGRARGNPPAAPLVGPEIGYAINEAIRMMERIYFALARAPEAQQEAYTIAEAMQRLSTTQDFVGAQRPARGNPLTDAEHMRTKKHTMELTDRMERVAMHEGNLGREDLADHWREMAQYVSGAGWAHMRASQGIPFPEAGYAATSGLEGAESEVLDELRAQAGPEANPCGAGGYGPAANPVKPDGRWHRLEFLGAGKRGPVKGTQYSMATAKGEAVIIPYKPRTFGSSRLLAAHYEEIKGQKVPKGAKWLLFVYSAKAAREAAGASWSARPEHPKPSAHKTLDGAKLAGEGALRRLPMPDEVAGGAIRQYSIRSPEEQKSAFKARTRSNPAELINAGILSAHAPIPSGIDSPPVSGGILAGSRPIPSGFRDPRLNVGLVDPPLTRRSKPDQPT